MPRLLPKNEIDKRRAEEQRQRMEEGLQIAGRVDTLRETVASEEVAFEKYRIERLKSIQDEIARKEQKIHEFNAVIATARAEYKRLTAPLDRKWEEVKKKDAELILKEDSLTNWEDSLMDTKSILDDREKEISVKKKQTDIQYLAAQSQATQAKVLFDKTKASSAQMRIEEMYRENELSKKEKSFETMQREFIEQRDTLITSLKEKEDELVNERKEITKTNQLLADRRKTLEREIARLNK